MYQKHVNTGILCLLLLCFVSSTIRSVAFAQSQDYTIQQARPPFSVLAPSSTPQPTPSEERNTTPPPMSEEKKGYLSITTSEDRITYNDLTPTEPLIRDQTIIINGSGDGYSIFVKEATSLTTGKQSIPDTSCDTGTCSITRATPWTSVLTYGFGYRCNNLFGQDCAQEFAYVDGYKPFPNAQRQEPYATLMTGSLLKQKKAQVLYKINIPRTQSKAKYINTVLILAVPYYQ